MNKKLLSFIIFLTFTPLQCIEKLSKRISLTTSITIPCHHKHAQYLYDLLEFFTHQSVLPQEIVISLSGTKNISPDLIKKIQNTSWPFKVNLVLSVEPQSEAKNRNIACKHARGDIIICQDADDLPHPQRIEIIKYFFETYHIVHLMHGLVGNINDFKIYTGNDIQQIKWVHLDRADMIFDHNIRAANGPVAFRRFIFDKVIWDESCGVGVDLRFNNAVSAVYKETIIILAEIYLYNWSFSSYRSWLKRFIPRMENYE